MFSIFLRSKSSASLWISCFSTAQDIATSRTSFISLGAIDILNWTQGIQANFPRRSSLQFERTPKREVFVSNDIWKREDKLITVGGCSPHDTSEAQEYGLAKNCWLAVPDLPLEVSNSAATVLKDVLYIWEAAPITHLWPGLTSWIANKVGGQWKKCRNSVWSGTKAGMRRWWEIASCSSGATRNCKHWSWNESKVLMSWKSWTNLGGWGTSGQAWVLHSVHLKRRSTFSRLRPSMKSSASTCSLASLFSISLKLNTEFVNYNCW